jgi:hypothetical protein
MATAKWIADLIELTSPNLVVNLGDTFDNHAILDVPSLCTGWRAMGLIAQACKTQQIAYVIIPGNHDAYDKNYASVEVFRDLGSHVYLPFKSTIVGGFGFFPFTKRFDLATNELHALEEKCPAVLTHVDVINASFANPAIQSPNTRSPVGVDPHAFRGPIFCGHYHHPADLGAFRFIGSVMYHNFTDEVVPGRPRGVTLATFDDARLISTKVFPNGNSPVYVKASSFNTKSIESLLAIPIPERERTHVSVKSDEKNAPKVKEKLEYAGFASFRIVIEKEPEAISRNGDVTPDTNPVEVLDNYMKAKGTAELDGKRLRAVGEDMLKEARL